ncbi:hypothetical protein RMATCC62417_09404 [Rhizopus microsporus]|nr:hypothetical protein RMATCC62417_09404 [Rhizopus microsporus]
MPLLCSTHRMIRARVIEILSVLFSWDPDPIQTLGLRNVQKNPIDGVYRIMLNLSKEMLMAQDGSLDQVMTGVSLLETSIELLKRMNVPDIQEMVQLIVMLIDICLNRYVSTTEGRHIQSLLKTPRMKNNVLQLCLRILHALILIRPIFLEDKHLVQSILAVLQCADAYMDQRVMKSELNLLQASFPYLTCKLQVIQLVIDMMNRDEMDVKGMSLVLDTFDAFLNDENISGIESSSLDALVSALQLKFLDTEWDVRDAAIQFVGQLFKEPISEAKVSFALKYDLPLNVLDRISDTEPYVRASAVDVVQNMMRSRQGWDYMQQHQESREFLASRLPSLLYDTEAFVRRATLDAIGCLIEKRSCQGMHMDIESKSQSLNPDIIKRLVDDQDPDVRVRGCRLIEHLWHLYVHEKHEQKKRTNYVPQSVFFEHIQAGELLTLAANDTHRLIRIESIRIIEGILNERLRDKSGKRELEAEDEFESKFLDMLSSIDIKQKKQTLDPEHIYEETFDINADLMINRMTKMTEEMSLDCE